MVSTRPEWAGLCRTCRLAPPPFTRAVAFGLYQGRMREVIHALKYERIRPAARPLGALLADAITTLAEQAPAELLVVPVPLHRSKFASRGFNQAAVLAAQAAAALRRRHPQWRLTLAPGTLMRLRSTDSQAGLTQRQRRLNVRGAFHVSPQAEIADKDVLLVDDILTTGATARACARALLNAGARSVRVATLARAQRAHPASFGSAQASGELTENRLSAAARSSLNPQLATMNAQNQPSF